MNARLAIGLLALSFSAACPAAETPLFPFVVSYDSPQNATNVSAWLERPAGGHGFVRAKEGHFATDAGPIRFWGTNLCFEGCFPDREQAERVAVRLARLGINCVRMHHMDNSSIWGNSPNKLAIDPKKLDRLDYLIYQLKQHGVYVNLNLHVSRWFGDAEGFPARDQRPNYDKGLDNFEPRMIELQKKYARDLLTHVNPYTKTAYTEEPAIAFVEISNEDALFAVWGGGQLDRLPEPYAGTFRKLWNAWLQKKYGTTEKLRAAWNAGLEPGQRLEDSSVPVLHRKDRNLPQPARDDFVDFLWDTEAEYWWGMYRYVKKDLGVRALVAGTQMGYSPPHVQAALDYVDAHSYWQHPAFPGRPWDPRDWYVRNLALVNEPGGTLSRLAATRVAGKPYTVSEYNHPAPISYAAEGFPMIAAFGALQGWDGVYSFAYSHNNRFEPRRFDGFFDIKSDPTRLVHTPACAALFVRGDVSPAKSAVLAPLSRAAERRKLHETQSAWTLTAGAFGVDPQVALLHAIGLDLREETSSVPAAKPKSAARQTSFTTDTGQLRWDLSEPGAGYFLADTPRTKLWTGFVRGREFKLGEVALRIGPTRLDWATVSMVAIDGESLGAKPGRVLIAATGVVQNTDAQLEDLGGNRVTLRNRWGTEPILCEGIPASIVLPVAPERVRFYPLDAAGNRRRAAAVAAEDGRAKLQLSPEHKTLWYEAEIR